MTINFFEPEEKLPLNICTIGHYDHGKSTITALVATVAAQSDDLNTTFQQTFKDLEDISFSDFEIPVPIVEYQTSNYYCQHLDLPMLMDNDLKNKMMLKGMDIAILVVSAADGLMWSSHKLMLLAQEIEVKHVIVFLNKTDLVDMQDETLEFVMSDIEDLLSLYGFNNVPIICGSGLEAMKFNESGLESIHALIDSIDKFDPEYAQTKQSNYCHQQTLSSDNLNQLRLCLQPPFHLPAWNRFVEKNKPNIDSNLRSLI